MRIYATTGKTFALLRMETCEGVELAEKNSVSKVDLDVIEKEQLKSLLEAKKREKDDERAKNEEAAKEAKDKASASLISLLDSCYAGIHEIILTQKGSLSAKVLCAANNLNVTSSWHAEEAFLALGKLGPKFAGNQEVIEARINKSSELSDTAKLLAVQLIKIYAYLKALDVVHFVNGNYVLGTSFHDTFGEVISFQRKKWKIYVYLDIGSYFFRKLDAARRRNYEEMEQEEKDREYYESKMAEKSD